MVEWRHIIFTLGFIVLCFVGVPIKIDKSKTLERELFQKYVKKFNKTYSQDSPEYDKHFQNFENSLEVIQKLNSIRIAPDSAIFGLTKYSDLSQDEFVNKHLRKHHHHHHSQKSRQHLLPPKYRNHRHNRVFKRAIEDTLPNKVDWRLKGIITPVKNQKTCGACWAFSVVETVEAMAAKRSGQLDVLSVQEIIDCARNGNLGCFGGDTCGLLEWLSDNNIKVGLEKNYPLVLKTEECKIQKIVQGIRVASNFSCDYLVGNEDAILATLAFHGPVAVAVNALPWQFYLGGVIQYHCDGFITDINHAVQLVGYDLTAPTPHFIARNSWGTTFGEKGYLKIAIGENICGVATEVSALDVL